MAVNYQARLIGSQLTYGELVDWLGADEKVVLSQTTILNADDKTSHYGVMLTEEQYKSILDYLHLSGHPPLYKKIR